MATSAWSSTTGAPAARRLDRPAGGRGALADEPVVLVAHSLGCILTAAWASVSRTRGARQGRAAGGAGRCGREEMRPLLPSWSPSSCRPAVCQRAAGQPQRPVLRLRAGPPVRALLGRTFMDYGDCSPASMANPAWAAGPRATCCSRPHPRLKAYGRKKPMGLGRGLEKPCWALSMNRAPTTSRPTRPAGVAATDGHGARHVPAAHPHGRRCVVRGWPRASGPGHHAADPGAALAKAPMPASTKSSPASGASAPAKLAGLDSVPVLVRDVPNEAAAAMALIKTSSAKT